MAAGEFPNGVGGKEMAGRVVRSPQENGLISHEDCVHLRDVRDKALLLPKGQPLHGHSGRLCPGAVIRISGNGDDGAPFSQDPRQEIEELGLAVSHEDLVG